MNMTAYRVASHRHAALSAVLFILVLMLGVACSSSRDKAERNPLDLLTDEFTPQEAEEFIGEPFPSTATGLQVAGESALDTIVLARFDAPAEEVTAWLAELGLTGSLELGYSPFYTSDPPLGEAADWWEAPAADSTETEYSGFYQQVGAKYYSVVVSPLENGLVRVHLVAHNT